MKKEEIKSAAMEIFAKKGYHDASMQEIADAVGINKATMYFHFASKADLFAEILRDLIPSCCGRIREAVACVREGEPENRLKQIYLKILAEFPQNEMILWKRTMLMCTADFDETIQTIARSVMRERDGQLAAIARELVMRYCPGLPPWQIGICSDAGMTLLRGVTDWMLINRPGADGADAMALAEKTWELFWRGCGAMLERDMAGTAP